MIGVLTCPSPKGAGMELNPFLRDGVVEFPRKYLFGVGIGFSPLGETGEGFV